MMIIDDWCLIIFCINLYTKDYLIKMQSTHSRTVFLIHTVLPVWVEVFQFCEIKTWFFPDYQHIRIKLRVRLFKHDE